MQEIWKDIKGYEELYQVSNLGRVRSKKRSWKQRHYSGGISHFELEGRIMKLGKNKKTNYMYIGLTKDKKQVRHLIHRLVAEAFLERKEHERYVNHLDNNPSNNRADNLEWCTQSHNIKYAYDNKTKIPPHMKKIYQIDPTGLIVNEFYSMKEAERKTNIKSANISKCCRNIRNYAGGYKWQYIK